MELWLWMKAYPGADRAWDEIRLVPPPVFHRFQFVGPYLYARMTVPGPEEVAVMAPRYVEVGAEYGNAHNFWKTYCEPRIEGACNDLARLGPGADLAAAAETWFYGLHQTFTCLALLFLPNMRLGAVLTELVGDDAELTGFELTQGGENATQAIDEEIWRLAELARATPAIATILASGRDDALAALRAEPAATQFVTQFDDLIKRHGRRSQGWTLTAKTWSEFPQAALALVRSQVAAERVSPDEWRERTAAHRREATERVLSALPPERHDEFREIIGSLDGYVNVREGRAYWQLVSCGAMRGVVLRTGTELVRQGRIEDAEDILFLTPEEYADGTPSDLRLRVADARKEWERYCALAPPFIIGTPGDVAAEAEKRGEALRGSPASRGVATGIARVLKTPEEGSRLQRGDILVCVMTTPAWTPLFAIAGGVITETGGALSHPAITAREYGIPAVLALRDATSRLRDGQTITIDGAAGTVSVIA
jgi:pyruvate,water dikinase